jgi:DNA-binding MarR family transcriptional regulator
LGPLETFVGFFLRLAQVVVYEDFSRDAPVPLTPGELAALVLVEHNPTMMQQELSGRIAVEKSTISAMLDSLAERKLIRSKRLNADRRRKTWSLTAKGKAALKLMLAHVARHERRVFVRLSPAERTQLVNLLKRVGDPRSNR